MNYRDYIPDGSKLTDEERVHMENLRAQALGGVRRDFVPGPGHKRLPPSGRESAADEALERALAAQAYAAREEFRKAQERLQNMSVSEAVQFIRTLPVAVMEMYLVAEEASAARTGILDAFPSPDPRVRERFIEDDHGSGQATGDVGHHRSKEHRPRG